MPANYDFPSKFIRTALKGLSALDVPRLFVYSNQDAEFFLKSYGYDYASLSDQEATWAIYESAINILKANLLLPDEKIPDQLSSRGKLEDLRRLLIYASTQEDKKNPIQMWSCAILRVMHCVAHVENDLFSSYTLAIQEQILKPIQDHIQREPNGRIVLGGRQKSDEIALEQFDLKAVKEKQSMVIKALSKPESVAIDQFDKIGVRFVTRSTFDAFRVVRYLHDENVISFANIMPTQSRNTIYPDNLFLELMSELKESKKPFDPDHTDRQLQELLKQKSGQAEYAEKENRFSSEDYRAIKFICRQMIKADRSVRFFYPFEVQIVDYKTYLNNLNGPASHAEYKKRQRLAARSRILGEVVPTVTQIPLLDDEP